MEYKDIISFICFIAHLQFVKNLSKIENKRFLMLFNPFAKLNTRFILFLSPLECFLIILERLKKLKKWPKSTKSKAGFP